MRRWITHKTFEGKCLSGYLLIPEGTLVQEKKGYIYYQQSRVCATNSENAWRHFHRDTPLENERYKMIAALENYVFEDNEADVEWRTRIRTASNAQLESLYNKYILKENSN